MIRFDAVTKQYPDGTVAVDDLTLTAPTGKITVLVGPSGCGKTTSLRMVNRMIEPTRGTITLDGQDTGRMDEAALRRGHRVRHPARRALPAPHRPRQHRHGAPPARLGPQEDPRALPRAARARGAGPRARRPLPVAALRAASSSASAWPGRSRPTRRSCSWTSRSRPSTPSCASSSRTSSCACRASSARRSCSSPTTSTRPSSSATRSRCCASGVGSPRWPSPPTSSPTRPTTSSPTSWGATAATARCSSRTRRGCRCARSRPSSSARRRTDGMPRGCSSSTTTAVRSAGSSRPASATAPSTAADLHRGGTVAREHGSLRGALDAALSSPSRRGVVVDDSGELCGTVLAHEVLTAIEETERPERDEADPVHGGASAVGAGEDSP